MLQILDVNPIIEAIFYYWGKVNGERAEKKQAEMIRRLPSHRDEIKKAADAAAALEKLLDSKLDADEALVQKFFKKIEIEPGKTLINLAGFCLASVMLNNTVMNHLDFSIAELCNILRRQKEKDRIESFLVSIRQKFEITYHENNSAAEFSRQLNALPIAGEAKFLILDAVFNYKTYINELLSFLIPAAKIIKAAENIYKPAVEEFKKLYSGDNAQEIFKSCHPMISKIKLPPVDYIKSAPLIIGFDNSYGLFTAETAKDEDGIDKCINPQMNSCTGFIKHLLGGRSFHDEITVLNESMKTLSDRKRLEMLFYLCSHRAYGQELCNEFDLKQPTMSYHIQKLLDAGFVIAELSGVKTYYTADKAGIRRMLDSFAEKIK